MSGCCLYCKFAESYWIDPAGNIRRQHRVLPDLVHKVFRF